MPMALFYARASIRRSLARPRRNDARIRAQTHGAAVAFVHQIFLLIGICNNNGMFSIGLYLNRMRALEPRHMSRNFHARQLHTITQTKKRNLAFAYKTNRRDNPFNAAATKTA